MDVCVHGEAWVSGNAGRIYETSMAWTASLLRSILPHGHCSHLYPGRYSTHDNRGEGDETRRESAWLAGARLCLQRRRVARVQQARCYVALREGAAFPLFFKNRVVQAPRPRGRRDVARHASRISPLPPASAAAAARWLATTALTTICMSVSASGCLARTGASARHHAPHTQPPSNLRIRVT